MTLLDCKRIMKESRVALSRPVCEKLNLCTGDMISFVEEENGRIYIKKAE